MTAVRVVIKLPHVLWLPFGEYPIGTKDAIVVLTHTDKSQNYTRVSSKFDAPVGIDLDSAAQLARREAGRLIQRANRLLRWYRHLTSTPAILEITRSQASPFWFRRADVEPITFPTGTAEAARLFSADPLWFGGADDELSRSPSEQDWLVPILEFEAETPVPPRFDLRTDLISLLPDEATTAAENPEFQLSHQRFIAALRHGLASDTEPDAAELNLMDARHAKTVGRFREAVLLSWSVIDSSFVRRFEALVDDKLAGEWGEARKFLKGLDFGLRHKMTSGLRLVSSRSFFDEPNGFWEQLSKSYDRRNKIIHEGASVDEDDAEQAIAVAQKVLEIIATL